MKYYCKNCGSEFKPGSGNLSMPPVDKPWVHCPFCEKKDVEFGIIPDYETPEQYKKRTGKAYPQEGPVWFSHIDGEKFPDGGSWGVCRYKTAISLGDVPIICVQGPNPPPDDWRLE